MKLIYAPAKSSGAHAAPPPLANTRALAVIIFLTKKVGQMPRGES